MLDGLEPKRVLVLGGGSAGYLSALTLKRMRPEIEVTVVHSKAMGVIGVGEGTTASFPYHLFEVLKLSKEQFYREAEPTWKQGIRLLWGERGEYFYDFGFQYDSQVSGLPKANGYYAWDDCHDLNLTSALMRRGKAFQSGPLGRPIIKGDYGFHVENVKLVACLERFAIEAGVIVEDDTLIATQLGEAGVESLDFASGKRRTADWYIDASGFRAELIGRALKEEYLPFADSLFCDRAVAGGWARTDEPIAAYTTAETMNCGWSWQIEHEHLINRGYVYSSRFLSDDEATAEFLAANPRVAGTPRIIRFQTGMRRRSWVGNVIAIGNSSGFVEPLEATALAQIIYGASWLAHLLSDTQLNPQQKNIDDYNFNMQRAWEEIRDFLALHYRFNTLRDTEFWRHCHAETSLGSFEGFYHAYQELGPSPELIHHLPYRPNIFGIEGYLIHLIGMRVPHKQPHVPSPTEQATWARARRQIATVAANGCDVAQTLRAIRSPHWQF